MAMTMFISQLYPTVKRAITHLVDDFQNNPKRFWNERDLHWGLFYYLKQAQVSEEVYPTELIRAEFPTLKVFGGNKPARGHYDLVIINEESYSNPEVQNMKAEAPWQEYLELLQISVAIEIKLWLNRLNPTNMAERADWDIQKLTDTPNNIQDAYFLNFVQLDFNREHNRIYYQQLREHLIEQKKNKPNLHVMCVPSDQQIKPAFENWL